MIKMKKDIYRISMRMNPSDPMQDKAARFLNTKGHHISEFVASAVVAYINGNSAGSAAYPAALAADDSEEKKAEPKEGTNDNPMIDMMEGLGGFLTSPTK